MHFLVYGIPVSLLSILLSQRKQNKTNQNNELPKSCMLLADYQGVVLQENQLRLLLTLSRGLLMMAFVTSKCVSSEQGCIYSCQIVSKSITQHHRFQQVNQYFPIVWFCRNNFVCNFVQPVRWHPSHNRTTVHHCFVLFVLFSQSAALHYIHKAKAKGYINVSTCCHIT